MTDPPAATTTGAPGDIAANKKYNREYNKKYNRNYDKKYNR
jgi:hypothetical protein